jgi:hypothetical protein
MATSDSSTFEDGLKHFKQFYGKLNVISEIIGKKKNAITNISTFDTIFAGSNKSRATTGTDSETNTLHAILNKQHDSALLIDTFDYPKQKYTEGTDYITKKFSAGNFMTSRIDVKIKFDVQTTQPSHEWFNEERVSIFKMNEEDKHSNINELYNNNNDYIEIIKNLFAFKNQKTVQYVWETKYNMLALFNQPFLLLTFDMYYYNKKHIHLFKNNFDVNEATEATAPTTAAAAAAPATGPAAAAAAPAAATATTPAIGAAVTTAAPATTPAIGAAVTTAAPAIATPTTVTPATTSATGAPPLRVESLLNIDTFYGTLPTFLMLLIYYAGYSFNIEVHDITSKFRNKFNQSSNKTSFPIKLYVPIPDKIETLYNNVLKSTTKPTSVDVYVESLEVYHVGGQVISLWDYVNGKLTILINNMLNTKDDKERYKTLFKKQYASNSLFLFDCIAELKKYKEYILNPANITTIAFPMSTLKTLEILILKLSYILSVLEPTFIPIETMSFDVVMNGKTLKYVINSELQATNISIEDHISNDKLMEAILSTRAASIELTETGRTKAYNLLSESNAVEIQKSVIQKQADIYSRNKLEKNIAYERIHSQFNESKSSLEQLKTDYIKAGQTDVSLEKNVDYMNRQVQHIELQLAHRKAFLEKEYSDKMVEAAKALLDALVDTSSKPAQELFDEFRKEHTTIDTDADIQSLQSKLAANKVILGDATKLTTEQLSALAKTAQRTATRYATIARSDAATSAALASSGDNIKVPFTVKQAHIQDDRRFGLSFGTLDSAIFTTFVLGKIERVAKDGLPSEFKNNTITRGYILESIASDDSAGANTEIWNNAPDVPPAKATEITTNEGPARTLLLTITNETNKKKIIAFQHFLNTLDKLEVNKKYIFTFEKPKAEPVSRVDPNFSSGGKNTTKKVNRRQRQGQIQGQIQGKTHSKTKKVFES